MPSYFVELILANLFSSHLPSKPHFLYFNPEPHGHGSFRPILTFLTPGLALLPPLALLRANAKSETEPLAAFGLLPVGKLASATSLLKLS